ncbi:MAG: AMP nucleosidase [Pseudomonadota bacterium]
MQSPHNGEMIKSPEEAVDALVKIHDEATKSLRDALAHYFQSKQPPSAETRKKFCYPYLAVEAASATPKMATSRAFARIESAGTYITTITQPRYFRNYLLEQLHALTEDYNVGLRVGLSEQEIPYPYVVESGDELTQGAVDARELASVFPTPQLALFGDAVVDGLFAETPPGEMRPLSLFDAVRIDFSLKRLIHYTGSHWSHIQPWILLTNYQRYNDQFMHWALAQLRTGAFVKLVLPGNIEITSSQSDDEIKAAAAASPWSRYQMPAYHAITADGQGITMVNIGVGPSNAKTITDHLAVLRPHCWLMVGHCGGLRGAQNIGDYVLAHAYLRRDKIIDELVPPEVPIPALAEVQQALQTAAGVVTGDTGDALKRRLRTGTVVTYDDRNWELRWPQERRRINLSRAVAVDMESGVVAAQGYRMRVPYGTLLCVSDKPLHGEIKLPGAAYAFYERAIGDHLMIGIEALRLLRDNKEQLHSRKLRSFDEPLFR